MNLPFTVEQFYDVFRTYNTAVWPAQWLLVALALLALVAVARPRQWSGVAVSIVLAILWTWIAVAFHLLFFARISPAATKFAALSLAGAAVFSWHGAIRRRLTFAVVPGPKATAGTALIAFALVAYPIWSALAGHPYPETPTFGLPCPTTIFTIGVLCFATPPTPRSSLVVPVLWCLVGAQAAWLLGVRPDLGLIAAGAVGLGLLATARIPHRRVS